MHRTERKYNTIIVRNVDDMKADSENLRIKSAVNDISCCPNSLFYQSSEFFRFMRA